MIQGVKRGVQYRILALLLVFVMLDFIVPADAVRASESDTRTDLSSLSVRIMVSKDSDTEVVKNGEDKYEFVYTGSLVTPGITISDGENILEEDKDYIVSGDSSAVDEVPAEGDPYKITIKGRGQYKGTKEIQWTIKKIEQTPLDNSGFTVLFDSGEDGAYEVIGDDAADTEIKKKASYEYTGERIAPGIKVQKTDGTELREGRDYVLTGDTSRLMYGTYKVKIVGIGLYKSSISRSWEITGLNLNEDSKVLTYNGEEQSIQLNTDLYGADMLVRYYVTEDVNDDGAAGTYTADAKVKAVGDYILFYKIYLGSEEDENKVAEGKIGISVNKAALKVKPVDNMVSLKEIAADCESDPSITVEKYMSYEFESGYGLLGSDDQGDDELKTAIRDAITYASDALGSLDEVDLGELAEGDYTYHLVLGDIALSNYTLALSAETTEATFAVVDTSLKLEQGEVEECYGNAGKSGSYDLNKVFGDSVPANSSFSYEIAGEGSGDVLKSASVSESVLNYSYKDSYAGTDFSENQNLEQDITIKVSGSNTVKNFDYDAATVTLTFRVTDHRYGEYVDNHNSTLKYTGTKTTTCESCHETITSSNEKTLFDSEVEIGTDVFEESENYSANLYTVTADSPAITFTSGLTLDMLKAKLTAEEAAKAESGAKAELFIDAYMLGDEVDSSTTAEVQKSIDEIYGEGTSLDGILYFDLKMYKRIAAEGDVTAAEGIEYLNKNLTKVVSEPEPAETDSDDGDEDNDEGGDNGDSESVSENQVEETYEYVDAGTDYKVSLQIEMPKYMRTNDKNRVYRIIGVGADGQRQNIAPTVATVAGKTVFQFEADLFGTYAVVFDDVDWRSVERVVITPTETTLTQIGQTAQLTATIYPELATNKNIIWLSGDENVVTVDAKTGLVKAVAEGTATIYVITEDGLKFAAATVTVDEGNTDSEDSDSDEDDEDEDDDEDDEDVASEDDIINVLGVNSATAEKIKKLADQYKISLSTLKLTKDYITDISSNKDLKGSDYTTLRAQTGKINAKSFTLKWSKVSGATGYIIYGNKCGKSFKVVKTLTSASKKSLKISKLKKDVYNKYIVVAYKKVDSVKVTMAASSTVYVTSSKGTKGVAKSVQVTKIGSKKKSGQSNLNATVKKGKTIKIKAKEIPYTYVVKKKTKKKVGKKVKTVVKKVTKKAKIKHYRNITYASSDEKVATVTSAGQVKGVAKGSFTVYAYAENGIARAVKVKVS